MHGDLDASEGGGLRERLRGFRPASVEPTTGASGLEQRAVTAPFIVV